MPGVAYDPNNSAQQSFLGALSLSEVGGRSDALNLGTGGFDLSDAARDQYGFPQWDGTHNSHAAGFFQFQPGTFSGYAQTYDLNFQNAEDQKKAAWYLAQDTFRSETGGELTTALQNGDYSTVEAALGRSQWLGARGKLATYLSGGKVNALPSGGNAASPDTSGGSGGGSRPLDGVMDTLKRMFIPGYEKTHPKAGDTGGLDGIVPRVGLFVVGVLILLAATWWLLSNAGVVPSAGTVAKTAVKVAAIA